MTDQPHTSVVVASIPPCAIHQAHGAHLDVPAVYDAKTIWGPWAAMCEQCYLDYGIGLGLGLGQRLVLKEMS